MKKTITLIILSAVMVLALPVTAKANGKWIYNPSGKEIPNAYYINNEYYTEPPSKPGVKYRYNGVWYVSGSESSAQTATPAQTTTPSQTYSVPQQQYVQPQQTTQCYVQPQQTIKPYYYDNAWHESMPTAYSKDFWYNGAWYKTAAAPQPVTQRPSAYVDNTANAKAQELVNYAMTNGVAGCYSDSTDSATQAQKYLSFSGRSGSFDMTLTTHIGSDGNYVTKYWRAGIERSLAEVQGWILGCR